MTEDPQEQGPETEEDDNSGQSVTEENSAETAETIRSHVADIDDGCGCTELWEHLTSHRSKEN